MQPKHNPTSQKTLHLPVNVLADEDPFSSWKRMCLASVSPLSSCRSVLARRCFLPTATEKERQTDEVETHNNRVPVGCSRPAARKQTSVNELYFPVLQWGRAALYRRRSPPRRSVTGLRPRPLPPRRKSFEIWRAIPGASVPCRLRHFLLLPDWLTARALFQRERDKRSAREREGLGDVGGRERRQSEHART